MKPLQVHMASADLYKVLALFASFTGSICCPIKLA